MRTVKQLIDELKKFPGDALAYAYEGEVAAVVIRAANGSRELGYIPNHSETVKAASAIHQKRKKS